MANSGEVQGQQVSKKPTDSAQFNMANFTYQGPAGTLYAAAAVVQTPGGVVTLIWASPNAVAIGVSAGNTPTVLSGATLPMTPGTGAYAPQPGIVDGVVVIGTDPDVLVNPAHQLFVLTVRGAYNVSSVSGGMPIVTNLTGTFS